MEPALETNSSRQPDVAGQKPRTSIPRSKQLIIRKQFIGYKY